MPCALAAESSPVHIYRGPAPIQQQLQRLQFACEGQVLGKLSTAGHSTAGIGSSKSLTSASLGRPTTSSGPPSISRSPPQQTQPDYAVLRVNYTPYRISANDSPAQVTTKLLHLLALGPITNHTITDLMAPGNALMQRTIEHALSSSSIVYDPNDNFMIDDHFPILECEGIETDRTTYSETPHYILKDKLYKDLQPWKWPYQAFERELIIQNTHHALTRLGFSQTHPLRRKLCDQPPEQSPGQDASQDLKLNSLGGGFLASKRAPVRKSATSTTPPVSAPASTTPKKTSTPVFPKQFKRSVSSLSLAQPQFNGQGHKRAKSEAASISDTVPNNHASPSLDQSPMRRNDYFATLASKFSSKYFEYEALYRSFPPLAPNPAAASETKKELTKLYELHNTLSQWKKILWDYDRDCKQKPQIMTLSKHKKTTASRPQSPAGTVPLPVAPVKTVGTNGLNVTKESHSIHPALASRKTVKRNLDY